MPNYLDKQLEIAARIGIQIRRIHIYDEAEIVKWNSLQWNDLKCLAERHKSPHEFLLCDKSQDNESYTLAEKGLVVPDLEDQERGAAFLLFHLPKSGIHEGCVIYDDRQRTAATRHIQLLLEYAIPWDKFEKKHEEMIRIAQGQNTVSA